MADTQKIFDSQINQGWGYTFVANGKYPVIGNRIFETYANAEAFLTHATAIEGLILRVTEDGSRNGAYLTELTYDSEGHKNGLKLTKLGADVNLEVKTGYYDETHEKWYDANDPDFPEGVTPAPYIVTKDEDGNNVYNKIDIDLSNYVQKRAGYDLSKNDYTDDDKDKLDGIEEGAQVNKIETVKVNGSALTITDKAVDIEIPDAVQYKIVEAATTEGALKSYKLVADGADITGSVVIDIAKDLVVTSGEVVKNPDAQHVGTFLKLVIAGQDEPIYINVADLAQVYTGDNVTIEISEGNVISVKEGVFSEVGHTHGLDDVVDGDGNTLSTILDGKSDEGHTHTTGEITDFATEMAKKSDTGHKHTTSEITDFATEMAKKADVGHDHDDTYSKLGHTHAMSDVDGLGIALNAKVDKVDGKGLSTNDLTDDMVDQYDAAYAHSQAAHAPVGAQKNVQSDWNVTDAASDAYIKGKPENLLKGTPYVAGYEIKFKDGTGGDVLLRDFSKDPEDPTVYVKGDDTYRVLGDTVYVKNGDAWDAIGHDAVVTGNKDYVASTGDYALIQGDTNRTIASIANELDHIVAEGGEPNLINEVKGELPLEGGSDDYVAVTAVLNSSTKTVTLDSQVKLSTLQLTGEDDEPLANPIVNDGLVQGSVMTNYVESFIGWDEIEPASIN